MTRTAEELSGQVWKAPRCEGIVGEASQRWRDFIKLPTIDASAKHAIGSMARCCALVTLEPPHWKSCSKMVTNKHGQFLGPMFSMSKKFAGKSGGRWQDRTADPYDVKTAPSPEDRANPCKTMHDDRDSCSIGSPIPRADHGQDQWMRLALRVARAHELEGRCG